MMIDLEDLRMSYSIVRMQLLSAKKVIINFHLFISIPSLCRKDFVPVSIHILKQDCECSYIYVGLDI